MHPRPARQDTPRRARPLPDARRGERGVSMVLALLVLFVITVVVLEVRFSASVELDHAQAALYQTRMSWLADAARLQTQSVLLSDVEQAPQGEEDESGAGSAAASSSLFGSGSAEGGEEEDNQQSIADMTARTDSRLDEWMNPAALAPMLGQDFQILVEVVDEDGKINLLGLWSPDEDQRDPHREIVRRLLDKAFEGTSNDLSYIDATDILDGLDDWVNGNRGTFDPVPKPKLKPTNEQEQEEEGEGLQTSIIDTEGTHYPLTLGELAMIEGIEPAHLSGFVEDDEFHPGLMDYLTVFSHLEIKPPPVEEDLFEDSPFTQGSLFDKSLGDSDTEEGAEDGASDDLMAEPTNDGLVNVNTAPHAVLLAIAPEDMPRSFIDKIVEFRLKIDELQDEAGLSSGSLLAAFDNDEGEASQASDFGDDEEEDVVKFVFETPEEVISKVEEEFGIELILDPGVADKFITRLTVTSQVFTIKILIVDPETGRRASWRTTVWRMLTADGARIVTLLPLEPYADPRRLKDFPGDLEELTDQRAFAATRR